MKKATRGLLAQTPFRVFGSVGRRSATLPPPARPLGVSCSLEDITRCRTAGNWFCDPALPFGLPSAMRFSDNGLRRPQSATGRYLLRVALSFRDSNQRSLVHQPQPTDSSHGLSLPTALQASAVHLLRACLTRYVPPSGFGYPLGGFLPPRPCQPFFMPAALLGFALRSFPLPKGIRRFPGSDEPAYRFSRAVFPFHRSGMGRPTRAAVSRLSPFRKSLVIRRRLNRQPLAAPLGFLPPGAIQRCSWPGFHPASSRTLSQAIFCDMPAGVPEFRSTIVWPDPSRTAETIRNGPHNPYRVPAPVRT